MRVDKPKIFRRKCGRIKGIRLALYGQTSTSQINLVHEVLTIDHTGWMPAVHGMAGQLTWRAASHSREITRTRNNPRATATRSRTPSAISLQESEGTEAPSVRSGFRVKTVKGRKDLHRWVSGILPRVVERLSSPPYLQSPLACSCTSPVRLRNGW